MVERQTKLHQADRARFQVTVAASVIIPTPNGEVEGPGTQAGQAPRAHTVFQRPRRTTTRASRPPPTIVRSHFETPVGVSERPTEVSAVRTRLPHNCGLPGGIVMAL